MKFAKATVQLKRSDIEAAIRDAVASQGWTPGKVEIVVSQNQYDGDVISATVEVEGPGAAPDEQPLNARAACRSCGREIRFGGSYWEHVGEPKPRHPAVPADFGGREG